MAYATAWAVVGTSVSAAGLARHSRSPAVAAGVEPLGGSGRQEAALKEVRTSALRSLIQPSIAFPASSVRSSGIGLDTDMSKAAGIDLARMVISFRHVSGPTLAGMAASNRRKLSEQSSGVINTYSYAIMGPGTLELTTAQADGLQDYLSRTRGRPRIRGT